MLDQDENLRNAIEHEIQALQAQKQAIQQERADIAAQTKNDAEMSKKAEEESPLVQRALEDSLPDQEPPLIGAAADKQKQKALRQYRDQTLAESSKFRTDVRRHWRDSINNALPLVASAAKEQKREVLVDQADSLLASRAGKHARDSIIARYKEAQNIPGVSFECLVSWSTADVRADLARAVIPNFDGEFLQGLQPPKRNPRFYHELTQDWMRDVYAGYDRTIGTMLEGAPAWAALDDGRALAQKFEDDRKKIRSSSEPPEVKNAKIARLDRAEQKGRCTPDDTRLLWNEIAEKLESAIEYRAIRDARDYLKSLVSAGTQKNKGKRRMRTNFDRRRYAFMFKAIQRNIKGLDYCRFLHQHGVCPQHGWVSDGCPKSYPEAYRIGKPWQKKIQDEKSRTATKLQYMEKEEPGELQKLLRLADSATR